jgi:hypothetical protein
VSAPKFVAVIVGGCAPPPGGSALV